MKLPLNFQLAICIIFLTEYPLAFGWRTFKVIFTSFPYETNQEILDIKAQIDNGTDGTPLTVALTFKEDVDDINLNYAILFESANDGNNVTFINRTVNFCKFLKQRPLEPILRIIYEDLLKQGNFMRVCPIRKGTYTLREYRVNEEMMLSYLPEAKFYVGIKVTKANGGNIFDGHLNGRIDKSEGFKNLKLFSLS